MAKLTRFANDCFWISCGDLQSQAYVLKDDKTCIVIDSGDGSVDIAKTIGDGKEASVDYCILTHGHFDHTGGVKEGWNAFLSQEDFRSEWPYKVPKGVKKLNFKELKTGSFDLEVIHTPGHTKGGICILEKERNILFTGDTLFSEGWVGRTDLPGGSDKELTDSLRMLLDRFAKDRNAASNPPFDFDVLKLDVSFLCSGHGAPKKF